MSDKIRLVYKDGVPDAILIQDQEIPEHGIRVDISDLNEAEANILKGEFDRLSDGDVDSLSRSLQQESAKLPDFARGAIMGRYIEDALKELGIDATVGNFSSYASPSRNVHVESDSLFVGGRKDLLIGLKGVTAAEASALEDHLRGLGGTEIMEAYQRIVEDGRVTPAEREFADNLAEQAMAEAGISGDTTGPENIQVILSPFS